MGTAHAEEVGEAWHAAVHGVAKSQTERLNNIGVGISKRLVFCLVLTSAYLGNVIFSGIYGG